MALSDMPPRSETEYDPVTLHNQALMHMDSNATEGFRKLNYLLQHPPFPPETLVNLLLLYCKYNYYDLAADILAENAELTYKYLEQDDYEFLDALILAQASPEEAYKRFDELSVKHKLRKVTKAIQDARRNRDNGSVKNELGKFDAALAKYIPVLMGQAKIYWDMENYAQVEKIPPVGGVLLRGRVLETQRCAYLLHAGEVQGVCAVLRALRSRALKQHAAGPSDRPRKPLRRLRDDLGERGCGGADAAG